MDLGSGITLPKHSGCQANGEIPSNSSFVGFESGNAVHGPQGCLDLLKSLGGTEGVLGSEGLYCATSPFQFWSQFPSCSLGEPVAAGSYMFASGSGSCQGAPHFDHSIQVNVGEIAQSGSHNMISVPWNDYGIGFVPQVINGTACSEAVAQFTPVTPDKNRVVSADLHRDVSSNKGIGLEVYIRGVTDNSKPAEECSVRCTVERENLPFTGSSAEFQGVYAGLSAPETPDKWRTILPGMTSENCRFPFPKTLEGSQQKGSGNALADTNHVEIAPNSCPGMQQDVQNSIVENNLADNEQATPQQKPRRKKHRPKVVIEGKQAKQKKASTPKPVSTPEIPGIKRKYVRKPKVNLPENLFGASTLDTPPVKRKYVRKQKTDSPETGGSGEGEQAGGGSVQQSVKRSLNFSVEDASMESPYKNVCTEGNRQADSQHKPNIDGDVPCNLSGSACSNVQNVPNSMRKDVYCNVQDISHDMKNDALFNVQNVSQNVSANMGGMADRSSQNTYVGGCSINHIQKECNFQGFLLHSSQSPRKNVLRENLKTLARENQRTGNSFTQGFHLPYSSTTGITKNKRSKRERSSVTPDYRSRSFILQNGFYTPNLNTNSPSCSQPLQFIPEQCKRKRSKAGQSEHHHDAPSPSAVHVSSQVGSSKDSQKIPPSVAAKEAPGQTQSEIKSKDSLLPASVPSVEAPRCSQLKVRFFNSSSSQVQKESLIAQANAACSSQLPPVAPRPKQLQIRFSNPSSSQVSQSNSMCFGQSPPVPQAAIQYYQSPSSVKPKAVTEGLQSKIPKSRAKKVQTPQLNGAYGMSSMFPPQSHMLGSSHAPLHFSFPQCNTHELIDWLIWKLIRLNINGVSGEVLSQINQHEKALVVYQGSGAMVPFDNLSSPPKKKKPRARVDLDSETNRVWLLLMGAVNVNGPEGTDAEKEKWWEEERRVFHGRAESFIARMHLVQGDRRFSPWKGSVVDSVVGVFLTQNVSDHLSSSAFMNLTSRFPVRRTPDWCKTPTENGDIYLVEFDECTKGEEKVQSGPINSLKSMVLISEDGESTEDKEILQVGQSLGEDCGITSNSSGKLVHVPQLTAESINHVDSKCIESLDSIVINLNAVASSQSSPSRPIRKDGATGMGLQFCIDIPSLEDKRRCCNVNTSSSFSELLQLASDNLINFQQQGPFASVTYEQESLSGNMKNTNFSYANKLEDSSPSVGKLDFYLHGEQNASRGIEYIPSQHPNAYPCEYHDLVTEKIQEGRGKMSSSPEAMLGVGDRCGIENSCINSCTKGTIEPTSQETSVLNSHITSSCDSHTKFSNHSDGSQGEVHSDQHSCNQSSPPTEREISFPRSNCLDNHPMASNCSPVDLSSAITDFQGMKKSIQALDQISSCKTQELQLGMCQNSSTSDSKELSLGGKADAQTSTITELKPQNEKVHNEVINPEKPKRKRAEKTPIEPIDWDLLRKEACTTDLKKERSRETMDSVDWETIRRADVSELSDAIRERGMNNRLAQRIKEFLDRLVHDHGSIDLEWLRDAPPDKVKDYLLSVKGLGLKSVECVRLLTLHHLAFPVDTNVGRICVRLGWVPLQPLPESLQLHLLELYPMLETIQKYLWPRLCKLDQRTLYELHYQMITFGKVFCTKSKPNCNACPMRGECKHFASAFASARLALPGPEEKSLVTSAAPIPSVQEPKPSVKLMALPQPENSPLPEECAKNVKLMALPQPENSPLPEASAKGNCEPIIEEPSTPEPECIEAPEAEIEDLFYEDPDEIPTIKLNIEKFTENLQNIMQENNMELQETDISKALVALTPNAASIPQPKLKNVSRLRTEHQVYELPDSHPLVEGLDQREPDDPSPYLLAIWSPGETAQSMELPQASCSSRETGILCNNETCSACNGIREARAQIVRGTLLIPCRTAMRGSFPLNGTYFQVNEVFADHSSSLSPIDIPRQWIWNLPRRTVYFGTSMPTIFKGLATEQIQQCFWRGFVCVRGFDRETRAPRPLMARLHFPASKAQKNKKVDAKEKQGQ